MADFPESEYEARLERAHKAMHVQGLDALFFTTEAEIRYFTGFRTLFWQSPTRPWFLVVPRHGKPIAVIPEIGASLMRRTWIDDIRTWSSPDPEDDGISLLASVLSQHAVVGVPIGKQTMLRMPLIDFNALAQRIPETRFTDATVLVQRLRMIKSEAEIAKIGEICRIASQSFANAPSLFREGEYLNEAFRSFRIDLLSNGADDVPYLVGGAGQGGYADVISPPAAQPLRAGDVLMLDTGATLDGYFCDFDRNFAIGHATELVRIAHRRLWDATEAGLLFARPGVTCGQLFDVMADVIGQGTGDVGRFGHGLGMQLTEPPSIMPSDETVLEAGMVLTLEPGMTLGERKIMVHEENIVIREDGAHLLSVREYPELPVL